MGAQAAIEAMAAIEAHTKANMVVSDPTTTTTMANRLSNITKAHTDQAQAAMAAIEAHTKANMVASDPTTTTTVANRLSAIITKADTDQAQAAIEAMAATEAMVAIAAMAAIEAIEAHTKANMVASDPTTTTTVANRLSAIIT